MKGWMLEKVPHETRRDGIREARNKYTKREEWLEVEWDARSRRGVGAEGQFKVYSALRCSFFCSS
jgi:hypothetical protein